MGYREQKWPHNSAGQQIIDNQNKYTVYLQLRTILYLNKTMGDVSLRSIHSFRVTVKTCQSSSPIRAQSSSTIYYFKFLEEGLFSFLFLEELYDEIFKNDWWIIRQGKKLFIVIYVLKEKVMFYRCLRESLNYLHLHLSNTSGLHHYP